MLVAQMDILRDWAFHPIEACRKFARRVQILIQNWSRHKFKPPAERVDPRETHKAEAVEEFCPLGYEGIDAKTTVPNAGSKHTTHA